MEEKLLRFKVFKDNLNYIDERNKKVNNYWLGLNEFADLSHEEFEHNYLGLKKGLPKRRGSSEEFSCIDVVDFPKSVDWRKEGAATSVKNQGSCGCCWAFSTVASVEGINQIVKGNLTSLSDSLLIVTHHSTMDEMEGVFDDECETYLGHGIAAVGYGTTKRSDYIIVKNSRGPKRGKRGYIRLKRNTGKPEGLCGTNKMASFPTKKSSDFQTHFI